MNAFHHLRNSFCILFPFPLSARNNLFYLDTPAYKIIFQTKTENSAVISYPLIFIPPINCHDWTNSGGGEGRRTPVRKYCHITFSERRRHTLFRAAIA